MSLVKQAWTYAWNKKNKSFQVSITQTVNFRDIDRHKTVFFFFRTICKPTFLSTFVLQRSFQGPLWAFLNSFHKETTSWNYTEKHTCKS